jgi:hypothetical protein
MSSRFIANAIYTQLGGFEFKLMTGARKFVYGEDEKYNSFLQFNLVPNEFNIHNYSQVRITLMPSDTYKLSFYQKTSAGEKEIRSVENIYCDQLQDTFELETNLLVTINQRRNSEVKVNGGILGKLVRG